MNNRWESEENSVKIQGLHLNRLSEYYSSWKRSPFTYFNSYLWNTKSEVSEGHHKVMQLLNMHDIETFCNFRFVGPEGRSVELDLYIPSLTLAVEYNGKMHFDSKFYQGSLADRQHRDSKKKELCKALGLTLIDVPYWWHNSATSLLSSIRNLRPDFALSLPKS